jgi:GTPase Era involved in 16S rRNA processing
MGPFIGKLADEATRREIVTLLGRSDNVRIVTFDTPGYINPNPKSPRLNLMLDAQSIIRDARCG